MTLLDILGKLPNFNINIGNKTITNNTLHLNSDGNFSVDGKPLSPEISEEITKEISAQQKSPSYPCQVIHKDLKKDYDAYEEISSNNKCSFRTLKDILPDNKFKMILMAKRVSLEIEDPSSSGKEISQLMFKLDRRYPKDGKKVLNLITAKYFDNLVLPMIDMIKEDYPLKYRKKFEEFFDSILKFFPVAVFVSDITSQEDIIRETKKRMRLSVPFIRIHTIGESNIRKVDIATSGIDFEELGFYVDNNKHTTAKGSRFQEFTIRPAKES
ncbi:hypothetical protein KAS08_01730 [Candidatus Pacearchaeota archaeon]|nr:hypothetical protein [Candidatus Pacearchaeota archaeon]